MMFIFLTAFLIDIRIQNCAEAFYLIYTFLLKSVHNIFSSCFYELYSKKWFVDKWPFYYFVLFTHVRSLYWKLERENYVQTMLALSEVLYFICTFNMCNGFLNEIILGTVIVQPEPVLNEDKDDFKGPEFRSRSKMKTENLKKRGGKYKWKWNMAFKLLFITILENLMCLLKIPPLFYPLFIKSTT